MKEFYVDKPDNSLSKVFKDCFPDYTGKKFSIKVGLPKRLESYWDSGSRDYFVLYDLDTGKQFSVDSNHPVYERGNPSELGENVPESIAVVKHCYFCGKDMGLTLYIHPNRATKLLPARVELTPNEKIVLKYTSSLKSSYAGISNYRFHSANAEKGITLEQWNEAKASLIDKKLLNKNGAITPNGRNALNG